MIFRAGLALNTVGSLVNGLMPARSLVAVRHGLPRFHLTDHDISAKQFCPSMRFCGAPCEQLSRRQATLLSRPSFPTAFECRHDAQAVFRRPVFAIP
jgi:hypothetical protein